MRQIVAYKDYFYNFYESLSQNEQKKIDRVMILLLSENRMPSHYISYLEQGIHELRITVPNRELRILFIYDKDQLVILFNCFVKKTRKTPRAEIEKAIQLKKQYDEEKQNG